MFNKKEEPAPKYVVLPIKDLSYYRDWHPKICQTLDEVGKILYEFPNIYQDVYELGKKLELDVHLHIRKVDCP